MVQVLLVLIGGVFSNQTVAVGLQEAGPKNVDKRCCIVSDAPGKRDISTIQQFGWKCEMIASTLLLGYQSCHVPVFFSLAVPFDMHRAGMCVFGETYRQAGVGLFHGG